ncbi:cytochrome P450 [Rhizophagus irregularis DAOM 181602=DAOM 197198]|uniref:Cytochrome P450 n=3 Tax=Rhizophagus irregularis TaxID=588596 RepID=A0A2H5RJL2_RHIID|nr:cytochrome P450 [Rhizophagus irregularis DAOM 181602=DAOM 197198]POG67650.1 cytochrome P450 [Rhizophagus irregularis DAOM 181602=DAOM 197198]GBC17955.1 cytochrome P450 [Rhizophagus irregularis DAOM 181602=DAOM 197198]|eukprot:XP_025174516.1 cytochrome P450 [Rhizophagus irregularis DAOM 181602=DAOM 197198]
MDLKSFENFGIGDFLLFLSTILTIYVAQYYYKYFTRVNPLPGPFPFPFVGNLPQYYLWSKGNTKLFYEFNRKKYGDIYEVQLNGRAIILSRVEYIEKLLTPSTKNLHMVKYPNSEGLEELGIEGKGLLLNQDLKSWKYNRQFFTQAILSPKFTNEAIDWTNKLFNELEGYWNKLFLKEEIIKESENKLDLTAWFNQYTNDMIIKLLTGERSYSMAAYFDTLSDEKSDHPSAIVNDSVKLVQAFRKHLLGFVLFINVSSFLRHYVPFFKNKADDLLQNIRFINKRLDEIIKRRRQTIENTPLDESLTNDMLTSLITANTPRDANHVKPVGGEALNKPMTDSEICGVIFDGFLGGTDTTANTISFVIYHIAHNPDVKKKMLEEIDRIFQGDRTRPITENDVQKLKYCKAIVKEVSRVLAVIPFIVRSINKPDEIAGYKWPAGTMFRINADAIHYNKDYWEDPDKFNPDRWMAEGFESKKLSFLMFGGGLRLCPGRKLAMIELVCLIALLYRKYEIDVNAPLKVVNGSIIVCAELLAELKPRN